MKAAAAKEYAYSYSLRTFYEKAGLKTVPDWADEIPIVLPDGEVPSKFQVENLNRILTNSYWGFLDEPGTGKTLPAQAYSVYMAHHGHRSLLVMPPVLRKQYIRSLTTTMPGIEKHVTWHIFDEDPYPVRVSKKRVQEIKRCLILAEPFPKGTLKSDADLIKRMSKAVPIHFTTEQIKQIRSASDMTQKELAAVYSCSTAAIGQIRNKTFRQDLVAKWKKRKSWPDLLIMSYQMFVKEVANVESGYDCLMSDEAHALCHPSSSAYKKTYWFLHKRDRTFLPMTGTPAPNVPTDTYGLIKLLNEKAYDNFASFKSMHVDQYQVEAADGRRFTVINGYFNLDMMSRALYARASRVTKDQVLRLDKPNIIEEEVELSEPHLQLYRKLIRERVLTTTEGVITASEAQSLRQKSLQIVLNPDVFTDEKIKDNAIKDWLTEKLDSLGAAHQEKVVIFAQFNMSVEKMASWFKHLNPALVYGKSKTEENVQKFLTDDSCRIMIAHPKSGGVGVDQLQTLCRYVIFVEPTSVPGDFTQALDRLVRRGQKHAVVCYVLKVMRTAWPKRVDEMRRKMKQIADVTMDRTALLDELLGK